MITERRASVGGWSIRSGSSGAGGTGSRRGSLFDLLYLLARRPSLPPQQIREECEEAQDDEEIARDTDALLAATPEEVDRVKEEYRRPPTRDEIIRKIQEKKEAIESLRCQPWGMHRKLRTLRLAQKFLQREASKVPKSQLYKEEATRQWKKFKRWCANVSVYIIPWQSRIKRIESHFGSVVSSYFTFLRWIFWINLIMSLFMVLFIVLPESLADLGATESRENHLKPRKQLPESDRGKSTKIQHIWDFEGHVRVSPLFYGFYGDYDTIGRLHYQLPLAYFLIYLVVLGYSFFAILRKMAANARLSKMSSGKAEQYTFAWKLFTQWDFTIGNSETAANSVASNINKMKETITEYKSKQGTEFRWPLLLARILSNIIILCLVTFSAYIVYAVVERSKSYGDNATGWEKNEVPIVVSVITLFFPNLFELVGKMEKYHPRTQLRLQLARHVTILLLYLLNFYTLIFALFTKMRQIADAQQNETLPLVLQPKEPEFYLTDTVELIQPAAERLIRSLAESFPNFLPSARNVRNVDGPAATTMTPTTTIPLIHLLKLFLLNSTMISPFMFRKRTEGETSPSSQEDQSSYFLYGTPFPDSSSAAQEFAQVQRWTTFLPPSTGAAWVESARAILQNVPDKELRDKFPFTEIFPREGEVSKGTDHDHRRTTRDTDTRVPDTDPPISEESFHAMSRPPSASGRGSLYDIIITPSRKTAYTLVPEESATTFEPTVAPNLQKVGGTTRKKSKLANKTVALVNLVAKQKTVTTTVNVMCWETYMGQEICRLITMDFVMTLASIIAIDFLRGLVVRYFSRFCCWNMETHFPEYGEFKVAENVLHIVNNQGMIWLGLFFSPLLPAVNNVKLILIMYLRSWVVVVCNVPAQQVFRASRSNNFYLILLLLMLFLCTLPVGYVIASQKPSKTCGPFTQYNRFYEIITEKIRRNVPAQVFNVLGFIASPGIIVPFLVLLILVIYFLVSLVRALKTSNDDLTNQLHMERTEEKRKIYALAGVTTKSESENELQTAVAMPTTKKISKAHLPEKEIKRMEAWREKPALELESDRSTARARSLSTSSESVEMEPPSPQKESPKELAKLVGAMPPPTHFFIPSLLTLPEDAKEDVVSIAEEVSKPEEPSEDVLTTDSEPSSLKRAQKNGNKQPTGRALSLSSMRSPRSFQDVERGFDHPYYPANRSVPVPGMYGSDELSAEEPNPSKLTSNEDFERAFRYYENAASSSPSLKGSPLMRPRFSHGNEPLRLSTPNVQISPLREKRVHSILPHPREHEMEDILVDIHEPSGKKPKVPSNQRELTAKLELLREMVEVGRRSQHSTPISSPEAIRRNLPLPQPRVQEHSLEPRKLEVQAAGQIGKTQSVGLFPLPGTDVMQGSRKHLLSLGREAATPPVSPRTARRKATMEAIREIGPHEHSRSRPARHPVEDPSKEKRKRYKMTVSPGGSFSGGSASPSPERRQYHIKQRLMEPKGAVVYDSPPSSLPNSPNASADRRRSAAIPAQKMTIETIRLTIETAAVPATNQSTSNHTADEALIAPLSSFDDDTDINTPSVRTPRSVGELTPKSKETKF